MKRLRVDEATIVKDVSGLPQSSLASSSPLYPVRAPSAPAPTGGPPAVHRQSLVALSVGQQQQHNSTPTIAYTSSTGGTKVLAGEPPGGMQSGLYSPAPQVIYSSSVMPSATAPHSGKPQAMQPLSVSQHGQMRNKGHGGGGGSSSPPAATMSSTTPQGPQQQSPGGSFQRLKVEDALSYLDKVKFKFGNKPQVYNDFLDIMKEFKSQSIDTPGVITRVSNLFKGYPELITGFNTFLPPGYKIEVQTVPGNDQSYSYKVSVSVSSPTASTTVGSIAHQAHPGGLGGGSGPPPKPAVLQILPNPNTIIHTSMAAQAVQPINTPLGSGGQGIGLAHTPPSAPIPPSISPATTAIASHHVPYQPNNLVQHNNNQHHHGLQTFLQAQATQQAVNQALSHVDSGVIHQTPQNQPVEFNHAINYVNKIKNRFQGQPEKYKRFLEILHTYQKEQRSLKDPHHPTSGGMSLGGKHLTEAEVYSQVAKLFENQEDLLAEFGQFLPDATSHQSALNSKTLSNDHSSIAKKTLIKPYNNAAAVRDRERDHRDRDSLSVDRDREVRDREQRNERHGLPGQKPGHTSGQIKRSPTYPIGQSLSHLHRSDSVPPPKKHKTASCRDVTLAEAGKYGQLSDYAFFDKVRKALRSPEVYENFLRCLNLFNQEIVSKSELVQLITPFLGKFPELLKWFKDFLGHSDVGMEAVPNNVARQERPQGDNAMEIDLTTCKRLGASYCALPKSQEGRKCSGRTQLCKEVLNDQWVSFPTWSEDSTFITSRKTQYEEYIYRCEDERFELDVVIETNASTIRVLEGVQKKLSRMSPDEMNRFRLDDCLGGQSPVIHQRAIRRIYGDKAQDIIDGLKRNPSCAVPVVLRRLKAKEDEWREAQKGFNKLWREQNEKYYLKSLDHQGINFKQNDVKALRSKSLFNEIETLYDERHEQNEEGKEPETGPHLVLMYRDKTILDDAANLLIHHVKRQTGIQKNEKQRIKQILRQFVPDLFFHPRQQLSDDEREEEEDKDDMETDRASPTDTKPKIEDTPLVGSTAGKSPLNNAVEGGSLPDPVDKVKKEEDEKPTVDADCPKEEDVKVPQHALSADPDEAYSLFIVNNNWYVFLRLHAVLCERLTKIYERAVALAEEEARLKIDRKESTAVALRLKPKSEIKVEDYYPAFLDMMKNVLDGNMDCNAFEDTLREMFGIHAYIAFTLDKVVTYGVRQLQHCVTDQGAIACMEIYQKEQRRGATGGACATAHRRLNNELAYQRKVETILRDENCFKIYIYKRDCRMTIELLDTESEDTETMGEAEKWSSYVERYADNSIQPALLDRKSRDHDRDNSDQEQDGDAAWPDRKTSYLPRNVRSFLRFSSEFRKQANTANLPEESRSESADKEPDALETLERKLKEKGLPLRTTSTGANSSMIAVDKTECKLNSATSKMLFVVNKDAYLHKYRALSRAKECHPAVTKRLYAKFQCWYDKWLDANVPDVHAIICMDWLMGRLEGVVAHRTRVLTNNNLKRTPYHQYNRYRIDRLDDDSSS